jgi:hypothetical protein
MPEPILEETTTDIDGSEPGELEVEADAMLLRSRQGGAYDLHLAPELEWLATRRLGLKVEPFFERSAEATRPASSSAGVGVGSSWKLVQDFEHDFRLQMELAGRAPTDVATTVEPGASPLPLSLDLRSGLRLGAWTLRDSLGVSMGGPAAHFPLRGSAALLTQVEPTGRVGFWGLEIEADGARADPLVAALELVPDLLPAGVPLAFGLVLPYSVGGTGTSPSYGILVRLFVESEREADFARTGHSRP